MYRLLCFICLFRLSHVYLFKHFTSQLISSPNLNKILASYVILSAGNKVLLCEVLHYILNLFQCIYLFASIGIIVIKYWNNCNKEME